MTLLLAISSVFCLSVKVNSSKLFLLNSLFYFYFVLYNMYQKSFLQSISILALMDRDFRFWICIDLKLVEIAIYVKV